MANIGGKDVGTNDLGVIGGGAAALIFSFFPWFGITFLGHTESRGAWGTGFLSWFPVLLSIVVAALIAAPIFGGVTLPSLPAKPSLIAFGGAALAAVLVVLKLLIGYHSIDRKVGLFLGVIAIIVQAYFAFMAFKADGGELDDFKKLGDGFGGSSTPPSA